MFISQISRLIDRSPRQLVRSLRRRALRKASLATFDDEHPCVFVLSTGRTGTKTLAGLCGLAPNVWACHEPEPLLFGLARLSYEYGSDKVARRVLREAFVAAREGMMKCSLGHGEGYVETGPHVTFLAPVILDVVTNVRFIHMVRDPRDVVRSGMRRKWYSGNQFDKSRIVPLPNSEHRASWGSYSPFQKNLWLWAETNRWILEFCRSVPAPRVLLVQAEAIFDRQEVDLRKLFAFLGASVPSERSISRVLARRLNAQSTGEFPEAPDWSEEMRAELVRIAGDTAARVRYACSPQSGSTGRC